MPLKLKGKYYSTVVRPATIYSSEYKEEAGTKTECSRNEDVQNAVRCDKERQSEKSM